MLPSQINILMTYSFCNLHDLSWGTKGLEAVTTGGHGATKNSGTVGDLIKAEKDIEAAKKKAAAEAAATTQYFAWFRSCVLISWVFSNLAWVIVVVYYIGPACFLSGLAWVVGVYNIMKLLGSALFIVVRGARGAAESATKEWEWIFDGNKGGQQLEPMADSIA